MSTNTAPSVDNVYGAFLLATFFSLILYGLILRQTYVYIQAYPSDDLYIRILVWSALLCETLHTVFLMHAMYISLVTNYSIQTAYTKALWSIDALPVTSEFSIIISLVFFVQRVWMMGLNNKHIIVFACACILGRFGFCLAMTTYLVTLGGMARFEERMSQQHGSLMSGKYACSAVVHIILTSSLYYVIYLGRRQRRYTDTSPKSFVHRSMLYILDTGLLVSVCDLVCWILVYAAPGTAWWIAFDTFTTKLYLVTFLSVLNSRNMVANRGIEIFGADSPYGLNLIDKARRQARAERWNAPQLPDPRPARIDIKVATEIEGEVPTADDSMTDVDGTQKTVQSLHL
ncbi:hypothetical protein BD311DRAFT_733282 [Dichomitus squalens]|uniref:DUF6534 domain-containing protein n=1 Tax=Dichomitus squalens TaxID=114155 RepID=A0A4V2JYS6_9APHY|nr:hypothetical protein BD311DRAFT_733282 [Dichomitus squalens]